MTTKTTPRECPQCGRVYANFGGTASTKFCSANCYVISLQGKAFPHPKEAAQ